MKPSEENLHHLVLIQNLYQVNVVYSNVLSINQKKSVTYSLLHTLHTLHFR